MVGNETGEPDKVRAQSRPAAVWPREGPVSLLRAMQNSGRQKTLSLPIARAQAGGHIPGPMNPKGAGRKKKKTFPPFPINMGKKCLLQRGGNLL